MFDRNSSGAKSFVAGGMAIGCLYASLSCSGASAQSIDMRTLNPNYLSDTGEFIQGISPYYTQSATASNLTIVGQPYQPNFVGTHNGTIERSFNGDFTATVTAYAGPHAGGSFDADFGAGGYSGGVLSGNQMWANYGVGFGNVDTQPTLTSTSLINFTLTRSGDVFNVYGSSGGAYVNLLTLTGAAVTGLTGFDLTGWGEPGIDAPETTIFSNLSIIPSVGGDISGLTGGTSDNPIPLPPTPVESVSGSIGGDSPSSEFYSFYWKGGAFSASVGVPDASALLSPPSYLFELCDGSSCGDIREQTIADSRNDWSSELSGDLGGRLLYGRNHRTGAVRRSQFHHHVRGAAFADRGGSRAVDMGYGDARVRRPGVAVHAATTGPARRSADSSPVTPAGRRTKVAMR